MRIETVKLTDLHLDPGNARKHSERNLAAIKESLNRFGQRKPIVVQGQKVLAGNGTLEAAKQLDWQEIQVVYAPADWDEETAKAFALADNRTAELAEWDESELAKQLLQLEEADWDIQALGFETPTLRDLDEEKDEVPEPPVEPTSKLGQVWRLGRHKLLCGDSTELNNYKLLLGNEKIDLVWTDPPYGVAYVGKTKDALTIQNDKLTISELESFLRTVFTNMAAQTKPGACWYVAAPSGVQFQAFSVPLYELEIWRHTLIWVKDSLVMGRADYHYRHEAIFYGWTPGAAHQEPPDRKQDTVWEIPRPKANKEHPTMKPLPLIIRAIENSSQPKQNILDPFGGSGSTLIAAEQTGRTCYMMELDPKYCDVIIQRWENLTGQKAELVM